MYSCTGCDLWKVVVEMCEQTMSYMHSCKREQETAILCLSNANVCIVLGNCFVLLQTTCEIEVEYGKNNEHNVFFSFFNFFLKSSWSEVMRKHSERATSLASLRESQKVKSGESNSFN